MDVKFKRCKLTSLSLDYCISLKSFSAFKLTTMVLVLLVFSSVFLISYFMDRGGGAVVSCEGS